MTQAAAAPETKPAAPETKIPHKPAAKPPEPEPHSPVPGAGAEPAEKPEEKKTEGQAPEPGQEAQEGEEEEISIEAEIDGQKRTLTGSEAIEFMNDRIEQAVEIFEATKRANLARLENPLGAMIEELAAGKFSGDRTKAGDHLLQLMETALLRHLEEADMPEDARRARELEARNKALEAKLAAQEKAREDAEWEEQVAETREQIIGEFHEAWKALELPDDDDLRGIVIERMKAQRARGLQPTVFGVAEKMKKEMDARIEAAVGRRRKSDEQSDMEAVRKSREEENAASSQRAPSKDGPERGRVLRDRDFLKDD